MQHEDIIYCDEISDHDAAYAVINIKKSSFEKRYKWTRNFKNLEIEAYNHDFSQLPINLIYAFDDPEEQIHTLNDLITNYINEHAPLKRVKITRPPAPWMRAKNV